MIKATVRVLLFVGLGLGIGYGDPQTDLSRKAQAFADLPAPTGDPSLWQWPATVAHRVIDTLGSRGTLHRHRPRPVVPSRPSYPSALDEGDPPGDGRGHGGMTYANWTTGMKKMVDLSIDVTFHAPPKPSAAVYLQLYDFAIGNTGQYFGFQYEFARNGNLVTRFIWSRWGTRDKANARVADGGWIESAGYEGDFVGIRYPYHWGPGSYTVQVMMRETDPTGTWYELLIYDHQKKGWQQIGRLRFPPQGQGLPYIRDGGGSWCEVYGGTKSSQDIGVFHLTYDGVYTCGRTVAARQVRFTYGKTAPNCNMAIDADGRRVHVRFGGDTRRVTKAGTYKLKE